MPCRRQSYPEKPWKPDPAKWAKLLEEKGVAKRDTLAPRIGWQLFRLDTLEDVSQNERP